MVDKHNENDNQTALYNDWVKHSIEEYGVLDLPAEEALTSILPEAEKKKTTRVDKALQKLKEDRQREEEIATQQRRERASQKSAMKNKISMISSVHVTEQDDESKSEAQSEH
jgi:hypothetical protein